jgi:hypothetical protein
LWDFNHGRYPGRFSSVDILSFWGEYLVLLRSWSILIFYVFFFFFQLQWSPRVL